MLETLKKRSRSSNIVKAVVSIIIAVGILAFTKFAAFDVITGPTKLDITADPTSYEGKHIQFGAAGIFCDRKDSCHIGKFNIGVDP